MGLYSLANQAGNAFRSALNTIVGNLQTNHYGTTDPAAAGYSSPGMIWVDSGGANPVVKIRNAADSAWISLGVLGTTFELNGTSAFTRSLLDDADAAAARATANLNRGLELITTVTPATVNNVDFTAFSSANYTGYRFIGTGLSFNQIDNFSFRFSTDGGSTYNSGATSYTYQRMYWNGTVFASETDDTNYGMNIPITASTMKLNFEMDLPGPQTPNRPGARGQWFVDNNTFGSCQYGTFSSHFQVATTDVDAIRFLLIDSAGRMTGGRIAMYGFRSSV